MININVKDFNSRELYPKEMSSSTCLTHGIHAYTAKLIPHIPRYFIKKQTKRNAIILDPFCGSGTTLLEARLLKRNAVGIDINPLAILLSKVKTTPLNAKELEHSIELCKKNLKEAKGRIFVDFPNKDYWFCDKAQDNLALIKYSIENLRDTVDEDYYRFLLVCFSAIIRRSSYADPTIAKTYKSTKVKKKIESGWIPEPIQYFKKTVESNLFRMKLLSKHLRSNDNYVKPISGDAAELSFVLEQQGINEVDFIITSPPYINAQDYFRSYKLELWWLGLATPEEVRYLNKKAIGTETVSVADYTLVPKTRNYILNKILNDVWEINTKKGMIIHNYFQKMDLIFEQCNGVLKNGGLFCLITGNNTICGIQIPTYEILGLLAANRQFRLVEVWGDEIRKRTLPPNRNHNGGIIKKEWIMLFQKES